MHCLGIVADAWVRVKEARLRRRGWSLPLLPLLLVVSACGGGGERGRPASDPELTVYAAASLAEVFPKIDSRARFSFAGSDELAAQIREGAPADVYAAASATDPRELEDAGVVEEPVAFASNRLVLIVPSRNLAGIEHVEDVRRRGTKLVLAAEGVPAGDYARTVLETLELSDALENVVSNEADVKGVLGKVALGEADAGFVYATDAAAAGDEVRVVELPAGAQPPIEYQIAVVAASERKAAAEAFIRKLLGAEGRKTLAAAGFVPP